MPFEKEFDTVCMFDVLEHIKDDEFALKNVYKSLKKEGKIVLTVPAHMWLWNRSDTIAGHKTRYNKKNFVEKVRNSGFEIIEARYFFVTIIPLLWLRPLLNKDNKTKIKKEEFNNDISMNTMISNILFFITRIENKVIDFLPNIYGGSLIIIGRKQ